MGKSIMHEQLCQLGGSPVIARYADYERFTFPLHHHSEYEIIFIQKSTGLRFVADSVEPYSPGDLTLFGSNLPHYMKNDEYSSNDVSSGVKAIIIQFPEDFMQHAMNYYPEFQQIKILLRESQRGINFPMPANKELIPLVKALPESGRMDRIINLIRLLEAMSQTKNYHLLKNAQVENTGFSKNDNRLEKTLSYIQKHYKQSIRLESVANKVGMNPAAFSRFFREKTSKTFSQYLLEIRIGNACNLLSKNEFYITQIASESGFNDIHHFNRCFKRITQQSPSEYRKHFL